MRTSSHLMSVAAVSGLVISGCSSSGQRSEHVDRPRGVQAHLPHAEEAEPDVFPGRIKSAFNREFQGAEMQDVEKRTHADGTVHWEVQYKDKAGAVQTVEFDDKGNLVK